MKLLMCAPEHYGIEYEINPWMSVAEQADKPKATKQWQNLYETLKTMGADIELIPQQKGWPDMVFTANGGLLYQGEMILPRFKYKERQGEVQYFRDWFVKNGFAIKNDYVAEKHDIPHFEGAGDALPMGNYLFVGYGLRSDRSYYETAPYLNQQKLIYCELVNPYYYHIDTCFCPINDHQAIWYPHAFSKESQERMRQAVELIDVAEEEAAHFACNAVVVGDCIAIAQGAPKLAKQLTDLGMKVFANDMSEYIKSGGSCKCLTLRIS